MAGFNLQGGSGITLQGSSPGLQAGSNSGLRVQPAFTGSAQYLQPAVAPARNQTLTRSVSTSPTNNLTPGGGGGGGTTAAAAPAGPTPEQIKAQQAQAMKGGLKNLVGSILGVYDAIYGDVNVAAADKVGQVNRVYGEDVGALTDQFNNEFPTIGRAYSARGTGSSGFRYDAEQGAQQGFDRTLQTRTRGRDDDLGQVGSWVAQQQAQVGADRSLNAQLQAKIDASTDPNELRSLEADLQGTLAKIQAQRSGLQSRASYMNTLNAAVPGGSQLPGLRQTLSNVISSQVPSQVKQAIGTKLIQNSGLPQSQVDALLGEFSGQISGQDREEVIA